MKNESFKALNDNVKLSSWVSHPMRRQILKAACLELLDMGTGNAINLNQLAKRAGMSVQRLRYHYKGFHELLPDIMMNIFTSGREVTMRTIAENPPTEPTEVIHRMVQGMFFWANEYYHLARISSIFSAITDMNSAIGKMYAQQFQVGFERLSSALNKAFPHLSQDDLYQLARLVHLYMVGALEDYHRKGTNVDVDKQIEDTWSNLQLLLTKF